MDTLILYILFTVWLQLLITATTRTRKFSTRALVRNLSIAVALYQAINHSMMWLVQPIIIEVIIEYMATKGYHFDRYIATEYLYSDYFEDVIAESPLLSNFSEGDYNDTVGLDTRDHSQDNLARVKDWLNDVHEDCFHRYPIDFNKRIAAIKSGAARSQTFSDCNGLKHDTKEIKYLSENNKFTSIAKICGIEDGMKILEIGFGKLDFMLYLRKNFKVDITGVSISGAQVAHARSKGFTAHHMNSWMMTPDKLGTYDLILHCGNIEYQRLAGESETVYADYGLIIRSLLKPGGKYFVTGLHVNLAFNLFNYANHSMHDMVSLYLLWRGNDGAYPKGVDGYSRYVEQIGLKKIYQEERTNDYYIYSVLWMSSLSSACTNLCETGYSASNLFLATVRTIAAPYYLHSYMTYMPYKNLSRQPWVWQFIPQYRDGRWMSPVSLQYLLFELPVETIESVEPAEIVEPIETIESVEMVEPVETIESVEMVEPAETIESVEMVKPTKLAEPTESVESKV
jgi:hypothetical protein